MTKLGAATASSSDEIAGGLERFSSISKMIGLSFEYAATSLATITSVTRQSEDVVGTALKTIFSRIQGLKLGETLEDGTDWKKYAEALEHLIKAYKELKEENKILKANHILTHNKVSNEDKAKIYDVIDKSIDTYLEKSKTGG